VCNVRDYKTGKGCLLREIKVDKFDAQNRLENVFIYRLYIV